MLKYNGYSIEFLTKEEQKEEYIKIALEQNPKSIKYLK